jgi:hypothetical protein
MPTLTSAVAEVHEPGNVFSGKQTARIVLTLEILPDIGQNGRRGWSFGAH